MGDWGPGVGENDESADWFHRFWREGWTLVEHEIDAFDPVEERFESLRSAAYVLASFGDPYMAPAQVRERLPVLLDRTAEILANMIDPAKQDWEYLDICSNDPAVVSSIENQIQALRLRRSAFVAR